MFPSRSPSLNGLAVLYSPHLKGARRT